MNISFLLMFTGILFVSTPVFYVISLLRKHKDPKMVEREMNTNIYDLMLLGFIIISGVGFIFAGAAMYYSPWLL